MILSIDLKEESFALMCCRMRADSCNMQLATGVPRTVARPVMLVQRLKWFHHDGVLHANFERLKRLKKAMRVANCQSIEVRALQTCTWLSPPSSFNYSAIPLNYLIKYQTTTTVNGSFAASASPPLMPLCVVNKLSRPVRR